MHKNFALCSDELSLNTVDFEVFRFLILKDLDISSSSIVLLTSDSPISDACSLLLLMGFVNEVILLPKNIEVEVNNEFTSDKKNKHINISASSILDKIIFYKHKNLARVNNNVLTYNTSSQISIFTSGTTGTPKKIKHIISNLISTFNDREIKYSWGLTYLPFKMAGIQVILSAVLNGDKLTISKGSSPSLMADVFINNNVDAISATPSMWRTILSSKKSGELKLVQCTLGGEIADQIILSKIKLSYPDAKVTHIYASTEIGVGFSVTDALTGFPVKFLNSEHPKFPQIKIKNDTLHFFKDSCWEDSGDIVEVEGNRVFFLGRFSGSINVGGNKVMPETVEGVIRNLPFVKEVKVYAEANNLLGNIVKADVELTSSNKEKESTLKKHIRDLCINKLPKYSVPVKISFVKILLTESGKIKR